MHTVIILSKHSSDLLREYRYLFQPFVDKGAIIKIQLRRITGIVLRTVTDSFCSAQSVQV